MRTAIEEGNPPHLEETEAKKDATFREFAQLFLDKYVNPKLRPNSAETYEYVLRKVLVPCFGVHSMAAITPEEVVDFHQSLLERPRLANLSLSILSRMFTQAIRWGYRRRLDNPAKYVERYESKSRSRFLSEDEVVKLWKHLDQLENAGLESVWICRAIKIAILTGMRRTEISTLRWDCVDLDAKTIMLRQHKTSRKVGERLVALNDFAVALLRSLPRVPGNSRVFPGLRPDTMANLDDAWVRIRQGLGMEDVHFHDFRHTFGTLANRGKEPLHKIGQAMGIATESTVKIYVHQVPDDIIKVAEVVGSRIQQLVEAG
jgi:integrase